MRAFDPRLTPARPDLAAKALEGKVAAVRYVEGHVCEVVAPQAPLRGEPRPDAAQATEVLKGERVSVYDENGEGWAWGQLASDGYVGWLPTQALAAPGPPPTHKVAALRTFAFPVPSLKAPPLEALPFGARLAVGGSEQGFALTRNGVFVPAVHLVAVDHVEADFVAVAERFIGVPYLWGGKTALGLDCSGLVQVALAACGRACPRDSDMQEEALGSSVAAAAAAVAAGTGAAALRRGDLVFWKGHVAIARDAASLIHANAFQMAVAVEPVAEAVARIRGMGCAVTSVRRLGPLQ